jgi:hypothetical protein
MSLTRVSDGAVLLSYSTSDINLLRTGITFYRPKWGIYRSVAQPQYLRDETVLFDNFCLAKGTDDCSAAADFDLSSTAQSQAVVAGGTAAYSATVAPNHGFNGNVEMSVSGLPAGTTASFDQASLIGAGTSQLTLVTTATTPPGTYTVTVTGTSGSLTHNSTVTLVVTPAPDFALSLTPPSQSVVAGNSATYTATVTPSNGFSGVVALGVSGLPNGTTAQFDNSSVTGAGSAQLTITTAAAVLPGTYVVTVTGTSGSLSHNTTITLQVTPAPDFAVVPVDSRHAVPNRPRRAM